MPYFAGPVANERDALLTFLEVLRAELRAAVFGLTDETARHAGHADIIRETLDGKRAGPLLDAYEAG